MSQCYIPSLYVVHFKGALDSGEAQHGLINFLLCQTIISNSFTGRSPTTGLRTRDHFRVARQPSGDPSRHHLCIIRGA